MKADDYGNFHGDDRIVSALCFPLGSTMNARERLSELEERGIIRFYANKGRKYININNFSQRLRQHTRKFPDPSTADGSHIADNSPSHDGNSPSHDGNSPSLDGNSLSHDGNSLSHDGNSPLEENRREVEENRNELLVFSGEVSPETEETSDPYTSEFETLWSAFPEKKGKGGAWRVWKTKVKGRISVEELVRIIHLQQLDRVEAKRRGEFYPTWQHPATWLNDDGWHNELKYAQKKERASGPMVPSNWREILIDRYPQNFPDGIDGANFPSGFNLLPASVQAEVIEHAALVGEIIEAIHANQNEEAA